MADNHLEELQRLRRELEEQNARIREFEARAQRAKVLAKEAEAQANEAEAQANEAEAQANEAEAQANEAEAQANEAEAQANEAEARANEAKARADEAKARADEAERKNQKTTLQEYLHNCHFHLYQKLHVANLSQCSKGYTKVEGNFYPRWLRPWHGFTDALRQRQFNVIRDACGDKQLFDQENFTRSLGDLISRDPARDESAVDFFEKIATEKSVWEILQPIWHEAKFQGEYQCTGLRFSTNRLGIDSPSIGSTVDDQSASDQVSGRQSETRPNKRVATESTVKPLRTRPDGLGFRKHLDGKESLAFVFDYKAAHKINVQHLRLAISKENLFTEAIDLFNSNKYSTSTEDMFKDQEGAQVLVAMALIQVFDYMLRHGVSFSYIAAGKSFLFLHINQADPQTLYCHPCMPEEDVGEASAKDWPNKTSLTAVAQLACFCLLSLKAQEITGPILDCLSHKAHTVLKKWREPYEDTTGLVEIMANDCISSASVSFESRASDDSDYIPPGGSNIALRSKSSCKTTVEILKDADDEEEDGPDGHASRPRTRSSINKRKQRPSSSSSENYVPFEGREPTRQYCTQACLIGLKKGLKLDHKCPNAMSHSATGDGVSHPITLVEFLRLVEERLSENPYRDCKALQQEGKVGAIGMLFKIELESYGYAFVGKGTFRWYARALEHESRVYARLSNLQGEVVPVCLGLIQLSWGYILRGFDRVFDMLLMSWGGECAVTADLADLPAERQRSTHAVWVEGVKHCDEREANMLWNEERRRVMIIDFDRASLLPRPKHRQLAQVSGIKRKRNRNDVAKDSKRRLTQSQLQSI